VLYIETDRCRYEICRNLHHLYDSGIKYRFSLVKEPFHKDNTFMHEVRRPLAEGEGHIAQVIEKDLDWSDFLWGEHSLVVKGLRYEPLTNYKYYPTKA
jgi:hypothetical protein